MVWYGMVWYGMVWYGMVWYGMVWYGMVWYGMVWYGMVWYGMVWYTLWCNGMHACMHNKLRCICPVSIPAMRMAHFATIRFVAHLVYYTRRWKGFGYSPMTRRCSQLDWYTRVTCMSSLCTLDVRSVRLRTRRHS